MTHDEKILWMVQWCKRHGATLELSGYCGFERECVGILEGGSYPEYEWRDRETYERIDQNGEVWKPENAYHKHPCVAVLGRGEGAEEQLYQWLKWFDAEGFSIEIQSRRIENPLELFLAGADVCRMVRRREAG